jgi:MFS family permease
MRSPLLPIFLVVLVDVLGLTIVLPLLPFYVEHHGASPIEVGLVTGVFAFCQLLSGPVLGSLSDRYGRKPMLLLSQIGTLLGFVLLARASALWMIFVSRIIDGVTAGNLSIAQAYIADVTEPKDRAKSFALVGIAFGLGFLLGPAVSGWLANFGYAAPVWLACALSATSILATAFLLPSEAAFRHRREVLAGPDHESRTGDDRSLEAHAALGPRGAEGGGVSGQPAARSPGAQAGQRLGVLSWRAYVPYFRRPTLGPLLLQYFSFLFGFALFTSGFALFAERRLYWGDRPFGAPEVGYVFAYTGLIGVLVQGGLVGRLVKRHGERRVASVCFAISAAGFSLLAVTGGRGPVALGLLVAAATLAAVGTAPLRPALTALVSRAAEPGEQGLVLGLGLSLSSIAQILAPLLSGLLVDLRLLSLWAALAAGAMLVGLALGARTALHADPVAPAPGARP